MSARPSRTDRNRREPHRDSGNKGHAIVVGASMAGLSIAKALTGSFDRVTVLDRDGIPDDIANRKGVPQGRHLHVLLTAGGDALEELFPGLLDEFVADGAATGDLGVRGRMCVNGHRLARGRLGRDDILASRPFVEGHVRGRVREDPAVIFTQGRRVRALVTTGDRRRVVGVEVVPNTGDGSSETLAADLVVDCSGRRSRMPAWLEGLGYRPPDVDELRVEVRYATRQYRLPADALGGDLFALITPAPDQPRGGGMALIEGDRWMVTLVGMGGEQPPLDPNGYDAFAARLPAGDIRDAIAQGQALDQPVAFRYPANVRRRYERLRDFPEGLLVAGDAVCSFNPIYGQGMTVAALEAVALRGLLDQGMVPSARSWFRSIAPIVDVPWDLAIGSDLAIPSIEGRRSLQIRLVNRYMDRFYIAAAHDPVLAVMFGRVSSLLDSPTRLLHPATVARVIRGNLRRPPRQPLRTSTDSLTQERPAS